MILEMIHLSKSFGSNTVLSDLNFKIEDHDRIGLIGENGKGKSTLLNIITGEYDYDEGVMTVSQYKKIGYLKQDSSLDFSGTIISEMRSVFSKVILCEEKMRDLENRISASSGGELDQSLASEYETEKSIFESLGGYDYTFRIKSVLQGMGFSSFDEDTPVIRLSGGERTRLSIAKLLLENPDLLILDEPTNHLDFRTLTWLEDYLSSYKGAILVVSHDRYFLEKIVTSICEIENRKLVRYPAGYTKYIELKAARLERMQKEYDKQLKEIAEKEEFIQKNIVRASTTKRAQSREKELEHMELKEKPVPPERPPVFRFVYDREPVKDVLEVKDLYLDVGMGSEHKVLNPSVNLSVKRGEKIAIVGTNGIGKTTFIKKLVGLLPVSEENVEWGRNVRVGYYDQQNSLLNPNFTMLEQMWDNFPKSDELTLRTALGRARLTGENVFKKIAVLSGGEKARLSFASLTLQNSNVLVLDEPTNHLDIICKESLNEALQAFTGTIIMVSHDRYLLNSVPTKIVEMFSDRTVEYEGKYDDYLRAKDSEISPEQVSKAPKERSEYYRTKAQKSEDLKKRNRIRTIEKLLADGDTRIKEIETEMADPAVSSDYEKINGLCLEIEKLKNDEENLMAEWEELNS